MHSLVALGTEWMIRVRSRDAFERSQTIHLRLKSTSISRSISVQHSIRELVSADISRVINFCSGHNLMLNISKTQAIIILPTSKVSYPP